MTDGIHLTFLSGDQHGSSVPVHRLQTVVFGSSVAADVQVNDPSVEPLHFEIRGEAGRFRLVDLGTPCGTRVNQKRVASCTLNGGERIQAGDMEWDVVRDPPLYETETHQASPRSGNRAREVEDSRVPPLQASSIAQTLDAAGYLLHEELGRGAYAAVYRAIRQSDRHRDVHIRLLPLSKTCFETSVWRFPAAARTQSSCCSNL